MNPYPYLVLTDLDHTMLGKGGSLNGVPETVQLYEAIGIPVIPVTAKSIYEIIAIKDLIGIGKLLPLIIVAESGAAVYASPGVLSYADGSRNYAGVTLEYVKLYDDNDPLKRIEEAAEKAFNMAGCRSRPVDVSLVDPEILAEVTTLPIHLARLIPMREHMKIYFSRDLECKKRVKSILEEWGFYVGLGRNFIHIGVHRGKEFAARWITINVPILLQRRIIAFGDSEPDRGMLEMADIPVVIPPEEGMPLRLMRSDYLVAEQPPPEGWVYTSRRIILNLF